MLAQENYSYNTISNIITLFVFIIRFGCPIQNEQKQQAEFLKLFFIPLFIRNENIVSLRQGCDMEKMIWEGIIIKKILIFRTVFSPDLLYTLEMEV